jgi:HD-GYP domain-containing protein (c-di-GMP phosphodiesterase class II)
VRSSGERWDGRGYPDGLRGEEIPRGSRVIAVCGAYAAMISERPHSVAMRPERALEELRLGAGSQFDPEVVAAFERLVRAPDRRPGSRDSGPAAPRRPGSR